MSTNEMNFKVKELRELRRMREELDAEIAAAEDSIKAEMTARDVDTLAGDDWKITWRTVRGSRFDSAAFKKSAFIADRRVLHGKRPKMKGLPSTRKSGLSINHSCGLCFRYVDTAMRIIASRLIFTI